MTPDEYEKLKSVLDDMLTEDWTAGLRIGQYQGWCEAIEAVQEWLKENIQEQADESQTETQA